MAGTELKEKIRQMILAELDLDEEMKAGLGYDTPLFGGDGIGADSVEALELVGIIYEEWGIDVPIEDMTKLNSVENVAEYIENCGK